MTPLAINNTQILAAPKGDTDYFDKAVQHFRETTGCTSPFLDMEQWERSEVLRYAQLFKLGLDVCGGEIAIGMKSDCLSMECAVIGTVFHRESERILCLRHFKEAQ